MSDLKPCPFCGSDKITIEWERCDPQCHDDTNRRWFAECTQCSCQGPFCQKEPEVAAKWNLQSRLTVAETRIKELEKLLTIAIDFIDPHRSPSRCAYNNNTMAIHLRAELDKLKGTK